MNLSPDLNVLWFILVGVLFTGYAVLDGFDLGVGALHLFTKTDAERRLMMQTIGPVWDGNEVWLVVGGGALFAAFPEVYATVFSGFYEAFILLLFALIFRAVAMECRSRLPFPWWRSFWDVLFAVGSIGSSLLIGVTIGNISYGIPLDAQHQYLGNFWGLLKPYPLLVGITTLALFMAHGAVYVVLKTEGEFHQKVRRWILPAWLAFAATYAATTAATFRDAPQMTRIFFQHPILFVLPLANILAIADVLRQTRRNRLFPAFLSSCVALILLMAIFGLGMFPNLVLSRPIVENSLTLYNAASSQKTLGIMLLMALIGIPLVVAYTLSIYWIFRGKTKPEPDQY